MTFPIRVHFLIIFVFCSTAGKAQNAPIGYWDSHLPYNTARGLATDGTTLFTITDQAFFIHSITSPDPPVPYSKTAGMADVGMQCVAYDHTTGTTVLVYSDANVDLFKDNTFYNIPDLKLKTLIETKKVNQVYTDNGLAYLCTTLGLFVVDLVDRDIRYSYPFSYKKEILSIINITRSGSTFYMHTDAGLFKADKDNPQFQDFQVWQAIDTVRIFSGMANVNNRVFLSSKKQVYTITNDTLQLVYTSPTNIQHIDAGYTNLLIGVSNNPGGSMKVMDMNYNIVDSFNCTDSTVQAVQLADSSIWVASPSAGLKKRTGTDQTTAVYPDGPTNAYAFDIYAYNKNLYIAHGGYGAIFAANLSLAGISNYYNGKWTYYKHGSFQPLDYTRDFTALAKNETTGTLYAGSYMNGLYILNNDGSTTPVDESIFDGSIAYGPNTHHILDLTIDHSDNLWITTMFAKHQLYVRTPANTWESFMVPGITYGGPITTDDSGQVWIAGSNFDGITLYNTRNTLSDHSDDISYHFTSGTGFGNLPSNAVNCLTKDMLNQVWVGTTNGIAIFKNCLAFTLGSGTCEAEIPEVHFDQHTGPLLEGVNVTAIAIDGINRKWVGTHDGGLYLLSPDGQQLISRFTKDNSPLPSNLVQSMTIDKATGDIYIGTDNGVMSYHGTATTGTTSNHEVTVFPNPVSGSYTGTIAIKGLVNNADVRITDITGKLVYSTKALGGQAIWNGRDYTGHRPQTGVYPFFVSDSEGKETYTGKIVFIQ